MGRSSCFNYFLCPDVSDETPVLCGVRSAARQLITSIACRSMMLYTAKGGWAQPSASCHCSSHRAQPDSLGLHWSFSFLGALIHAEDVSNDGPVAACAPLCVCVCCCCCCCREMCAGWWKLWNICCVHTQNTLLALLLSEFQTLAAADHFPRLYIWNLLCCVFFFLPSHWHQCKFWVIVF